MTLELYIGTHKAEEIRWYHILWIFKYTYLTRNEYVLVMFWGLIRLSFRYPKKPTPKEYKDSDYNNPLR